MMIRLTTDGACIGNPGPGGWAFVLRFKGRGREASGAERMARADRLGGVTNAINPDLRGFFQRGGKLLHYHGWSDPGISPFNSIDYYNNVLKFMGGPDKVEGSYRLFMVPGMDHCGLGEGPTTFDAIGAIQDRVEQGKAPERIIVSRFTDGKVDRSRPLCPYPRVAKYKGMGSTDDAANFACGLPRSQPRSLSSMDSIRTRELPFSLHLPATIPCDAEPGQLACDFESPHPIAVATGPCWFSLHEAPSRG